MGLMDTIKGWFGGAKEQGAEMAQKAEDFAADAVDTAQEKASDVMDSAKDTGSDAVDTAREKASDVMDSAKDKLEG